MDTLADINLEVDLVEDDGAGGLLRDERTPVAETLGDYIAAVSGGPLVGYREAEEVCFVRAVRSGVDPAEEFGEEAELSALVNVRRVGSLGFSRILLRSEVEDADVELLANHVVGLVKGEVVLVQVEVTGAGSGEAVGDTGVGILNVTTDVDPRRKFLGIIDHDLVIGDGIGTDDA